MRGLALKRLEHQSHHRKQGDEIQRQQLRAEVRRGGVDYAGVYRRAAETEAYKRHVYYRKKKLYHRICSVNNKNKKLRQQKLPECPADAVPAQL